MSCGTCPRVSFWLTYTDRSVFLLELTFEGVYIFNYHDSSRSNNCHRRMYHLRSKSASINANPKSLSSCRGLEIGLCMYVMQFHPKNTITYVAAPGQFGFTPIQSWVCPAFHAVIVFAYRHNSVVICLRSYALYVGSTWAKIVHIFAFIVSRPSRHEVFCLTDIYSSFGSLRR